MLTTEDVDVSQIEEILITQSTVGGVSATDKQVAAQLKAALEDRFDGLFGVHVTNYASKSTTVDELLQNKLTISYQLSEDTLWYSLQNGKINIQGE